MKSKEIIHGLVSIIMPSWNTENFIAQAIRSVLDQTYTDFELIIVDDCSSDNTMSIIKSFNDKRIRYYQNKTNLGAALTRNKALREANGEWIAFLDSDDIWLPNKLEKQLKFMIDNGYSLSYTQYEKIDEQSNSLNIYVSGPDRVSYTQIYNYDYIGQLTMMYSAKVFGTIQTKDIKKNNDYALRLELFKQKDTCAFLLKEILSQYRVRKNSISHDKFYRKLKSHYELFRVCAEKPVIIAFYFTLKNMFFGIIKKIRYENEG